MHFGRDPGGLIPTAVVVGMNSLLIPTYHHGGGGGGWWSRKTNQISVTTSRITDQGKWFPNA